MVIIDTNTLSLQVLYLADRTVNKQEALGNLRLYKGVVKLSKNNNQVGQTLLFYNNIGELF